MFHRLKNAYWITWPQRWLHRRGFGIHSPWAYELVTDALFDRHRFYAFDQLHGTAADEQLFRLSNWLRPAHVVATCAPNAATRYLNAPLQNMSAARKTGATLLYFTADRLHEVEQALKNGWADRRACLVLDGIRRGEGREVWSRLVGNPSATSTFDLGNRGIAFFNPAHQKQNYLL